MKRYEDSQDFNTTNETNEFEENMKELNEWQENQYNPGYYVGTGRVPRPVKELGKYSGVLILIGILVLLPVIFSIANMDYSNIDDVLHSFITLIIPIFLGVIFIYSGIKKWINNR